LQVIVAFCESVEADMALLFDKPGACVAASCASDIFARLHTRLRHRPLVCVPDFRSRITAYFQGSEARESCAALSGCCHACA
jgi:hypothetical protein